MYALSFYGYAAETDDKPTVLLNRITLATGPEGLVDFLSLAGLASAHGGDLPVGQLIAAINEANGGEVVIAEVPARAEESVA